MIKTILSLISAALLLAGCTGGAQTPFNQNSISTHSSSSKLTTSSAASFSSLPSSSSSSNFLSSSAFSSTPNNPSFSWPTEVLEIIASSPTQWASQSFDPTGRLPKVITALKYLAHNNAVDDKRLTVLLDYIAILYSNRVSPQEGLDLSAALLAISQMPHFFAEDTDAKRVKVSYLNAVKRHISLTTMATEYDAHINVLINLYQALNTRTNTGSTALDTQLLYALLNTHLQLANDAFFDVSFRNKVLAQPNTLLTAFMAFSQSSNIRYNDNPQAIDQALNVLRYYYWLYDANAAGLSQTLKNEQVIIDNYAQTIVITQSNAALNDEVKTYFYNYLINTNRNATDCTHTFATVCQQPVLPQTLSETFDAKKSCNANLVIHTQKYSATERELICAQLNSAEDRFHTLMLSDGTPVPNDDNASANLYIFNSPSEYMRLGEKLFSINTNNGGLFIEGLPQDATSQSIGYLFRGYIGTGILVWGLDHEFTHYLDNRFNIYGLYSFAQATVWWAEGLADYMKYGANNPLIHPVLAKQTRYTLAQIFAVRYGGDAEIIYQWGYLAMRFFLEQNPEVIQQLRASLRAGDYATYNQLLNTIATNYQSAFSIWLMQEYEQ